MVGLDRMGWMYRIWLGTIFSEGKCKRLTVNPSLRQESTRLGWQWVEEKKGSGANGGVRQYGDWWMQKCTYGEQNSRRVFHFSRAKPVQMQLLKSHQHKIKRDAFYCKMNKLEV